MIKDENKRTPAWRRGLMRVAIILGGAYLGICLLMFAGQRKLMYHPQVRTVAQVDELARANHLLRWTNAAGENVGFRRPGARQPARGQVLVTYGNGSTGTGCAGYADDVRSLGDFDVFILEYPGYEDRPGTPTQAHLFRAADEALQLLSTNLPLYLIGESLGTGVASYLAGTHPDRVRGVVLLAPFNHISGPAQYQYPWLPVDLLLLDHFPSDQYLTQYHGPVGVFIGTADRVVPEQFGRQLYEGYAGPKRLWVFPGADHGDVFHQIPEVAGELKQLWHVE